MIPILAEPGGTHDGNLETMYRLIDLAVSSGATAIKPQWTSSPRRMVERRQAPGYLEAYRRLCYPLDWHRDLRAYVGRLGLGYVVSVYLPEDVRVIVPYVDAIKIASFESSDLAMLRAAAVAGRFIYVSTGMLTQAEAMTAGHYADLLFHCVSAYPAPPGSLNLRAIRALSRATGKPVGFSDHTRRVDMGALAVAAGAAALEVHIRLDDCRPDNPDFAVALGPAEFREYVSRVRVAEAMMGDGIKRPMEAEAPMQAYQVRP